jgi:hypothetical protein
MTLKLEAIASIVRATRLGKTITRNEEGDVIMDQQTTNRGVNLGVPSVEEGAPQFAGRKGGGPSGRSKFNDIIEAAKSLPPHSDKERYVRVPSDPGVTSERSQNALRTALKRQGGLDSKEWKVRLLANGDLAVVRV